MPNTTATTEKTPSETLDSIIAKLSAKKRGNQWQAQCPAHEDNKPSLSISTGESGRVLLHCHAGCSLESILSSVGLTMSSLFSERQNKQAIKRKPSVIATYEYRDEQGVLLFETQRKSDKSFTCRKPKDGGGWLSGIGGVRRVLYRLPELLEADPCATVYVCEGEKDADNLAALGLIATTSPFGAGKWRDEYNASLQGREVVVLPDNDESGRSHASEVVEHLREIAASVRVLALPNLPEKGDVSDWLAAGGDAEQLCVLAEQATELKQQAANTQEPALEAETGSDASPSKRDWFIDHVQKKATFFHNADTDAYASVQVNGHVETYALRSRSFKTWLNGVYFKECHRSMGGDKLKECVETLEAIGVHQGDQNEVGIRVMEYRGNVYLDLCDREWRVVEITPEGWRLLPAKESPVKFIRSQGMLPLPEPTRGGDLSELKDFLNSELEPDSWALIAGWLAMTLHPFGPYPLLSISGEQGSAKSTATRVLRSLIDPNRAAARAKPKNEQDLMIAAKNSWILAFDNLSSLTQEQADAFCRIATGAAYATRRMYTDNEEEIFSAKRPQILNGINDNSEYPDLLDRTVSVFLPAIADTKRRDEHEFWKAFELARPRILGALLDAVCLALANVEAVELSRKPRMADFAKWAVAAEPALGLEPDAFIVAYTGNREIANASSLDTSPAKELKEWAELQSKQGVKDWSGKVSALLEDLNSMLRGRGEDPTKKLRWPKLANQFSGNLNRIAPNLRAIGIDIQTTRRKDGVHVEVLFSP